MSNDQQIKLQKTIDLYHQNRLVVIPLKNKVPYGKNWPNTKWSEDYKPSATVSESFGWVIPEDYIVIDVDNNHGNSGNIGSENLQKMSKHYCYDFLRNAVIKVNTASGGLHLYFKKPKRFLGLKIKNSLAAFPSVEFKGHKRQVVIPGSTLTDGRSYSFYITSSHNFDAVKELPENFMLDLIAQTSHSKEKNSDVEEYLTPLDSEIDQQFFKDFLAELPEQEEGDRNNSFYQLACVGRDYGLSKKKVTEILLEFNDIKSSLLPSEVKHCVNSAFKYAKNKFAVRSVAAAFQNKEIQKIEVNDLCDVKEFDVEAFLPEELQGLVNDVSFRLASPSDFIAISLVIGLSSIIAGRVVMRPKVKDDFCVSPNLWGGIICNPSARKSDSLTEALFFFSSLEKQAEDDYAIKKSHYDQDFYKYKITKQALEEEYKKLIKANKPLALDSIEKRLDALKEPIKPSLERYKLDRATTQKVTEVLRDNKNPSLLLKRDELSGFMSELDDKENESDRSYYLESWNGGFSPKSDTISRGSVSANNASISIVGTTQHDKIRPYLEKAVNGFNDGLLQRFQLLIYPNPVEDENYRDESPNLKAKEKVTEIVNFIISADFSEIATGSVEKNGKTLLFFSFDSEAQEIYQEWYVENNKKVIRLSKENKNLLSQHLGKYHKLLPALCLIFHLAKAKKAGNRIGVESIRKAVKFCEYLESHAARIYGMIGGDNSWKIKAVEFLDKAKKKYKKTQDNFFLREFTPYDLGRKFTAYRGNGLDKIIDVLVENNYLSEHRTEAGFQQREKYTYAFNPDLIKEWETESMPE